MQGERKREREGKSEWVGVLTVVLYWGAGGGGRCGVLQTYGNVLLVPRLFGSRSQWKEVWVCEEQWKEMESG